MVRSRQPTCVRATVNHARRIGPFTLAEVLAEGRDSVLYRATRAEGARPPHEVTMRVATNPLDPISVEAIRHEFNVLRTMDSPRIPKAYAHYDSDAAVATSHHAGVSLEHILNAQREGALTLGAGTAIDIAIEIAHAVRHARRGEALRVVRTARRSAPPGRWCSRWGQRREREV